MGSIRPRHTKKLVAKHSTAARGSNASPQAGGRVVSDVSLSICVCVQARSHLLCKLHAGRKLTAIKLSQH
eukprot:5565713-Amphidinium_carterae.1